MVFLILNARGDLLEKFDEMLRRKWGDSGVDEIYILRENGKFPCFLGARTIRAGSCTSEGRRHNWPQMFRQKIAACSCRDLGSIQVTLVLRRLEY